MGDISYVAAVGGSAVAGLILWSAYGRYQSPLKRAVFTVVAFLIGFVAYFVLGVFFIIVRPELARETGVAIGHGFKVLTTMLLIVNAVVLSVRGRAKNRVSKERIVQEGTTRALETSHPNRTAGRDSPK